MKGVDLKGKYVDFVYDDYNEVANLWLGFAYLRFENFEDRCMLVYMRSADDRLINQEVVSYEGNPVQEMFDKWVELLIEEWLFRNSLL